MDKVCVICISLKQTKSIGIPDNKNKIKNHIRNSSTIIIIIIIYRYLVLKL